MQTLRSWKTVTGPDLDLPSLTFQSWYEAQWGAPAFAALNKIPKEMWQDYLLWVRDVLQLPVRNGVALVRLDPALDAHGSYAGHVLATVREGGSEHVLAARKVVLAMGIASSGRWWMPEAVESLPAKVCAHTAEEIDFSALAGRRVAVLGAGASAFDNAAAALEAGAAEVRLYCRRPQLQRVQPYKAISFSAFFRHFGDLDDATRWRFVTHLLTVREALPVETWNRVTRHANFHLHTGSPWQSVQIRDGEVEIHTPQGRQAADFLICGTGFDMDLSRRAELAAVSGHIATWADRYPPAAAAQEHARLSRYPYLGPGLQLLEKVRGTAPILADIHLFDFGATASFGPSGSSINAMKYAVPRLVGALTRDLFFADIDQHYARLLAYDTPEFPLRFARDGS
jgi:cation diffusion facilitator CzcD-associated flavoprotein CzcO